MKNKKLVKSIAALSFLVLASGGVLAANAASNTSASSSSSTKTASSEAVRARGNRAELTEAQKTEMEAKRAEMDIKINNVKTALESGDYNAWVEAEKAINVNSPILTKVTTSNFNRFVEAHKLRAQADSIMTELGIDRGEGRGFGGKHGFGGHENSGNDAVDTTE